ncbi:hypothetical protein MMC25_004662 [Agyrium rufum]|nr:hypothetical protein [Agyrium rufum]
MRIYLGPLRFLLPKAATRDQWRLVHDFIDFLIEKALQDERDQTNDRHSLLHDMIGKTSNTKEIRDQIIQAMTASLDTTALLISNTMFLLSRNPEIWERLRRQTANLDSNQHLTVEDTKKSKLLRYVLLESLRLYPVFPILARVAFTDTVLPTGGGANQTAPIFVNSGTTIPADFYALHRDESVFGPAPETFKPDRWDSITPNAWEFMGFGGGMRACLGQHKALSEASCFLLRATQRYIRVESRDDLDWSGDQKLVARNVNGCKMALISA